ncbi:MAG: hypothetical protein GC181_09080 [Bacteroidetes bacterium]|nr:hypothetical protein [Bacteroidota bacterium]
MLLRLNLIFLLFFVSPKGSSAQQVYSKAIEGGARKTIESCFEIIGQDTAILNSATTHYDSNGYSIVVRCFIPSLNLGEDSFLSVTRCVYSDSGCVRFDSSPLYQITEFYDRNGKLLHSQSTTDYSRQDSSYNKGSWRYHIVMNGKIRTHDCAWKLKSRKSVNRIIYYSCDMPYMFNEIKSFRDSNNKLVKEKIKVSEFKDDQKRNTAKFMVNYLYDSLGNMIEKLMIKREENW